MSCDRKLFQKLQAGWIIKSGHNPSQELQLKCSVLTDLFTVLKFSLTISYGSFLADNLSFRFSFGCQDNTL